MYSAVPPHPSKAQNAAQVEAAPLEERAIQPRRQAVWTAEEGADLGAFAEVLDGPWRVGHEQVEAAKPDPDD